MNLGQVLHTRWAANGTLNGLLPVGKVMTGDYFAEDPKFPYATVGMPNNRLMGHANDGSDVRAIHVQIVVYHAMESYDEGLAIAEAVMSAFNWTDFALSGADRVLVMRPNDGVRPVQRPDGDWTFVIDYECLVHLSAGV